MKNLRIVSLIVLSAIFLYSVSVLPQEKKSDENKLKIEESFFCTKIKNREPEGVSKVFSSDAGRVYLWMTVSGMEKPTKIKHVWYYGVKKMREIQLDVKYKRTRTWSYKNILPQWSGDWHVEILDENDRILGRLSFRITELPNE
ncbi:DUF2914 domain-containing protein [Candidatus Latescibacterota bacterium]